MLKTKSLILFLFICSIFNLYSQKNIESYHLSHFNPTENTTDFLQIDSIFKNKRLIGLGECTHGTSEFTSMRHRIFKYLVENHGFNTIFIEADYGATMRLNAYINGENDSINPALYEILYFAWRTVEMKKLVEWMREYNQNAPVKIQFIGCDMQSISDERLVFERYCKQYKKEELPEFIYNKEYQFEEKESRDRARNEWNAFYSKNLSNNVGNVFLDNSISQFLNYRDQKGTTYNYRDSCMATNILTYMKIHPKTKAIFIAHNSHVSRTIFEYENYYPMKRAGYFLNKNLGKTYLVIAQTTNTGSFHAFTYPKKQLNFSVCDLKPAKKKTVESFCQEQNVPLLLLRTSSLTSNKKLRITEIGHTYGKDANGFKHERFQTFDPSFYDFVLYFERTSPTQIISRN
jgi:erythromycin esterase